MSLDHSRWPKLAAYWDEYGMAVPFTKCDDVKMRDDGAYAVVRWKDGKHVQIADLVYVNGKWDMVNDGFDSITEKDWTKLRITPHCDSFTIPGNEDFS